MNCLAAAAAVTYPCVSFPGAHGVFSFAPAGNARGFFLAPGFFLRCGLILARVRLSRLLRTGEPYEPRSQDHVLTGLFFDMGFGLPGKTASMP